MNKFALETTLKAITMMKYQMLFAVCALLAVYVSSAAVEPVELQQSVNNAEGPVQIMESFEEVVNHISVQGRTAQSLPFRRIVSRPAAAGTVQTQRVTFTGRAGTRISSWKSIQLTVGQGEMAFVVAGGIGRNSITVEIRSQRGRGFNVQIEVLGDF